MIKRKSVFCKIDFKLVNIPHPTSPPSGQYPPDEYIYAPVHTGVHYSEMGFHGSKVWFVNSPFPGYNDDYENPCVWHSKDTEYPAEKFTPYIKNPITDKPGAQGTTSFNADPDILIAEDKLLVINREHMMPPDVASEILNVNLYEGVFSGDSLTDFKPAIKVYSGHGGEYTGGGAEYFASPGFVYFQGKYMMFDLISMSWNTEAGRCSRVRRSESASLFENCFTEWEHINFFGYKIDPWHFSVFEYNGELYSILAAPEFGTKGHDTGRVYLGKFSSDLKNLYIFEKPLTDFVTYRSDAYVDENGLFVLYANSFSETWAGGFGYGGREVFVASKNFEEILRLCN